MTFAGSLPEGARCLRVEIDGATTTLGTSIATASPMLVANLWRVRACALSGERLHNDVLTIGRDDRGGSRGGLGWLKQVPGQN